MSSNNISSLRNQLLARGYKIIPNRGKVPVLRGWNTPGYVERQLTDGPKGTAAARVARWDVRFPEAHSTGLLICDGLVVIDIDVDDAMAYRIADAIATLAPAVYQFAPTRFGASQYKMAFFCRLDPEDPQEAFVRLASRRYGEHCVEIFGGKRLRNGNVSRQFGIYGPHSYRDDGSVAANYVWDKGQPALHEIDAADLPLIRRSQAAAIIDDFETMALAAGWTAEAPEPAEGGTAIYDITDETRFDTDKGGHDIDYSELCEQYAAYGPLRCASNFMAGRDGTSTSRCRVSWSYKHECVAVWVDGDETWHYPIEATADPALLGEAIADVAEAAGVEIPEGAPDWRDRFASGLPRPTLHNTQDAIEAAGIVCSEDTFHNRLWIGRGEAGGKLLAFMGEMTDISLLGLRVWLSDRYGLDFGEKNVRDAALAIARRNAFDPVCDMLAEAEANWDGIARLDRMAVDHFNAEDTPFNRQCVRKVMIAAVARARRPGCKFDTILVMESVEGWNKSSAWALLAGEDNFSDASIIGHNGREVQEHLARVWIHENAELAGMRKAEVEVVKSFASRQVDYARPAYGRLLVAQPRHSIEVGTTNNERYLQSQTGNRRFWPILVTAPIDLGRLREARLQLWGEAAHYQAEGEELTLDEALWPAAAAEQEKRRVQDPWEIRLAELSPAVADGPMAGFGNGIVHVVNGQERVSSAVIFEHVLRITSGQLHNGHSKRLADCMRVLGWKAGVFLLDGRTARGYVRNQIP